MKKIALIVLIISFVFFGCDPGNGTNGDFTASTNDTVSNDAATLGLEGTSVSSSNSSVATAEIVSGKIKITSVNEGAAVITVKNASDHTATINVTVSKTGAITIGTITKYVASKYVVSKIEITNADVLLVQSPNPPYDFTPYTGKVNSISPVDFISGSIINGKLNLAINAPSAEKIAEQIAILKDIPEYYSAVTGVDFDMYLLGYLAFPVTDEATIDTKMVLALFRDGDVGNLAYFLIYSTASGEITLPFFEGLINVNEGWNFLDLDLDTDLGTYTFSANIPFPIRDNYKWYIYEGEL
ncbi:hypothetical protein FACS1894151_11780 [Spirochaetia bacterium]|nr:hypothetical protein FACS1894151_11780 [Spirochaetia bacterium]